MASNTIIQCASSSSLSLLPKYAHDVFVSFRGEDTRHNFTAFLFQALSRNGIDVFKDDQDLKKGESIAPELLQAIQGSRLFVVVFSKNYASSTWCLRELVHICNCIQTSSRQLLPIFYDVDPSEVRKQSASYQKAFVEHEERLIEDKEKLEEVQKWRQALTQVSNLSGWDIRNKPQHVMLDEIVQRITNILGPKFSSLPNDHLVGMESRIEELAKLLHSGSINDVRVIGITGMSGIGKTALACALYERISHHYDSHCFIDVSRIYRDSSALGVQKQLLSQSLNEKSLEICNVSEGTFLVWTRLRNAKRLIIFDNVDQVEQLKMFSGNRGTLLRECLGGGSRNIIVSRDEQILRTYEVDDVYQVQPLNLEDANQLFCRYAFKSNYILSDYEMLIHGVLSHTQGHPLAIEVIGNSLFGKHVSYWRSALASLRKNMSNDIMSVLRIGFEELDDTNKEIFLDIACCLSDFEEKFVKEILDIRGFNPEYGLQVLVNKSLIIVDKGWVLMPNVLRDLGKLIVKEKSPKEPRKWSRLWDSQDLQKVTSDNMDETNIEVIFIRNYPAEITVNDLSKLRNLKLLIFLHTVKTSGSINGLPNELEYLFWDTYPCHCLPQSFEPHKLVKLTLFSSNIKQLWEDIKPLHNLKYLDLSHSQKLVKLQNFGEAINLKSLNLNGCIKLKQIDPTFGFPRNLTTLNLKDCCSLINLPHFRDAVNLEILNLQGCTQLRQIDPSIGLLKKLTFLNLKYCESLVNLPKNILELSSLEYLSLFGCSQLYRNQVLEEPREAEHSTKLCIREAATHSQSSSYIFNKIITWLLPWFSKEQKDSNSINWLLPSMPIFSCLCELDLSFCNLFQVPDAIGNLHSLERLSLRGNNFAILPSLKQLSKLLYLNLQHCKQLENLPELPSQTDECFENYNISQNLGFYDWPENCKKRSGLNIFNCPKLGKRESCSSMCFAWMMQILKAHHQYNPKLSCIIGGSEIPSWFNNQLVCIDNSISFDASHIMDDNNCLGVAWSAIFVVPNQRTMGTPKTESHMRYTIPVFLRADLVTDESDHLWLSYSSQLEFISMISYDKKLRLHITVGGGDEVEVKKYGYRVVYKEDLQSSNFTTIHTQTSLPRKRKLTEIEENE